MITDGNMKSSLWWGRMAGRLLAESAAAHRQGYEYKSQALYGQACRAIELGREEALRERG